MFLSGEKQFPVPSASALTEEDIRQDLLRNGVIAKLTEVLSKLNSAVIKPEYPLDFLREELGGVPMPSDEIDIMERELGDAQREMRRLTQILQNFGVENVDELLAASSEHEEELLAKRIATRDGSLGSKKN